MKLKTKVPHKIILMAVCFFFLSTCLLASSWAAKNRFTTLQDGTVKDEKTGLNWAPRDNGGPIAWSKALAYCKTYSVGGHNDWRMPSSEELATLYGNRPKVKGQDYQQAIDVVTKSITITGPWVWTSQKRQKNRAIAYGFNYGTARMLNRGSGVDRRILPVRSAP